MYLRVIVLFVLVELLGCLSSLPKEKFLDSSLSANVKANSDPNMMMSPETASNMDMDYYMIPSGASEKQFGGNRSDEFLYPPDSYYKKWAEEERIKDEMANNC